MLLQCNALRQSEYNLQSRKCETINSQPVVNDRSGVGTF